MRAFSDADWASGHNQRYSTSGVLTTLAQAPVIHRSRKQIVVATSSIAAEFTALYGAARELVWLTQILTELEVDYQQPTLHIDNQSTIAQIKNERSTKGTKYMKLRIM